MSSTGCSSAPVCSQICFDSAFSGLLFSSDKDKSKAQSHGANGQEKMRFPQPVTTSPTDEPPSVVQQVDRCWHFSFEHGDKYGDGGFDTCSNQNQSSGKRQIPEDKTDTPLSMSRDVRRRHQGRGGRPAFAAFASGACASAPLARRPLSARLVGGFLMEARAQARCTEAT